MDTGSLGDRRSFLKIEQFLACEKKLKPSEGALPPPDDLFRRP
jgi:hypothetical protein